MKRSDFIKTIGAFAGGMILPLPTGLVSSPKPDSPALAGGVHSNMALYKPYDMALDTLINLLSTDGFQLPNNHIHTWHEDHYPLG